MTQYYATEERAMAPGISGEWPDVIPHPTNKNARLVKVDPLTAGLTALPTVVDKNGVRLQAGQTVNIHSDEGVRKAIVVEVFDATPTANRKGHWVDVNINEEGPQGMPSYLMEVVGEAAPVEITGLGTTQEAIHALIGIVHYQWAVPRGWWTDLKTGEDLGCDYPSGERPKGSKSVGDQISLIHSEVSEAYEGHRKNKQDKDCPGFTNFEIELADAMIRILDTAGGLNLRLAEAFESKMEFNRTREDHKPENRMKDDGKKT